MVINFLLQDDVPAYKIEKTTAQRAENEFIIR